MAHSSWGSPCKGQIKTLTRPDGVLLPVRVELVRLVALLADETERMMYDLIPGWCWGYACRRIRGSRSWSNHAWGLAIDINAPDNPMGPRNGKIRQHPKVIALWKEYGFRWGGDYSGRADDMHMEFVLSVQDCARLTDLAQRRLGGSVPLPHPPAGTPALNRVLRRGMFGGDVTNLQKKLNDHSPASRDIKSFGSFGPVTEERVRQFQTSKGLKVDGVVGSVTWKRLWS